MQTIYMGKLKVRLENQIVYTMPFRILQKIWDIARDDAIFFYILFGFWPFGCTFCSAGLFPRRGKLMVD